MGRLIDEVDVADGGRINTGGVEAYRWGHLAEERSVVEVQGWVKLIARERGKIVATREGKNIWTTTGREYLAMLMSRDQNGNPYRSDRVAFIGLGIGSQIQDVGVTRLASPIEYASGLFLADLDAPTFPLSPSRTTVQYRRLFTEAQVTLNAGAQVNVSEMGLFTDRVGYDATIAQAGLQPPVAYKSFDPIGKISSMDLEVFWEIRF